MCQDFSQLRTSYSRIAEEYGDQYWDELANKPLDRELLDRLAAEVGGSGPICDMGCGPGQIARYLTDRGAEAIGVDISKGMVAEARLSGHLFFHHG